MMYKNFGDCVNIDQDTWEHIRARVYVMALQLTKNRYDADDLTQEAVIRVQQGLPRFRGESGLFTWIYKIVLNTYRDQCRHFRNSLYEVPLERIRELRDNLDLDIVININGLLEKLPALHKKMFLLKEHYGYSYQEIASFTQSSLESVRSRIYRARKLLEHYTKEPPG